MVSGQSSSAAEQTTTLSANRIAARLGIPRLYHYAPFCPDRLIDILRNHRIFCSNPANFNDPWDCKPCFDPELITDAESQSASAEYFISNQSGGPHGDMYDDALRKSPFVLKSTIKDLSDEFTEFIPKNWGVYCLAKRPCNSLMWSHYSRGHTGICLEFQATSSHFRLAYEVLYRETYPQILPHEQQNPIKLLITKSDVWNYEEEFRLICPRFPGFWNNPLIMEGNYLAIAPDDLKSIIVGCRADYDVIKALIEEHAPSLPVKRAQRLPNKYRLSIED